MPPVLVVGSSFRAAGKVCPGSDRIYQVPGIIAQVKGGKPGDVDPVGSVKPSKPSPKGSAANVTIQKALTKMGIDVGYPDGVNGPKQKAGVNVFQQAHGLVEDGVWGPKTKVVYDLNKKIRQALKKQGYTKQTVDGYYGALTEANVRDFQRRTGLVKDGVAGPATQKRLGL